MAPEPPPSEPKIQKKSTVRITLPPKPGIPSPEAKKETIRITIPHAPSSILKKETDIIKKETVRIGEGKKETIRINLPTQPGPKRDTIRINLPPGQSVDEDARTTMPIRLPGVGAPVPPSAPKPPGTLPVPPAGTLPVPPKFPAGAPLPPKLPTGAPVPPKAGVTLPTPPAGALPSMPKPPVGLGAKPPVPPAAPSAPAAPVKPVTPKKETTRIPVPPNPKTMPKATVKLNQTAPLASMPAPSIKTAEVQTGDAEQQASAADPFMLPFSIAAVVAAGFAFAMAILAS